MLLLVGAASGGGREANSSDGVVRDCRVVDQCYVGWWWVKEDLQDNAVKGR